jgi:hypothetical protein
LLLLCAQRIAFTFADEADSRDSRLPLRVDQPTLGAGAKRRNMTVLEQILEWSKDRPAWQRDALRRLVVNGELKCRKEGPADESWYWVAPMLLDFFNYPKEARAWWNRSSLAAEWGGSASEPEDIRWPQHVDEARKLLESVRSGSHVMGPAPSDLPEVLALTACSGPSVTVLRALARSGRVSSHDLVGRWPHRPSLPFIV